MITEKIAYLIQQRIHQATSREISKKANIVAKAMGKAINEHDILDGYDDLISLKGYYYYPLHQGLNMEIKTLFDDYQLSSVNINFNGYNVFHEAEGNVESYVPNDEWENKLTHLFEVALKRYDEQNKVDKNEWIEKENLQNKQYLNEIKNKWGFK